MTILDFYKNVLHLTDEALLEDAIRVSEIKKVKQGHYLVQKGQKPIYLYFLVSGVARGFLLDVNGKDITDCIVYRCGESIMPDIDFSQPATVAIETLKDCEVVAIPIVEVQRLLTIHPDLMQLYQKFVMQASDMHRSLKIITYQYTAAQRYEWFLKTYPGLIDRVSHKYIASLLNMTPVTLSKVRAFLGEGEFQDKTLL